MKNILKIPVVYLTTVILLQACSSKAEDDGGCKRKCNGAVIGSSDYKINAPVGGTVKCTSGKDKTVSYPLTEIYTFKFSVLKEYTSGIDKEQKVRPVGGLKYQPNIFGNAIVVNTDSDETCSDSCGIVEVAIQPDCPPAGETYETAISVTISSTSSDSATLTVENTDDPPE